MTKDLHKVICKELKQPDANYYDCFTTLKYKDNRLDKLYEQRKTLGYDDSETWSLYYTIANFILPRLKRFKELTISVPCELTEEEWKSCLDQMIYAFEYAANRYERECYSNEDFEKVQKGFKLFGEFFLDLWW